MDWDEARSKPSAPIQIGEDLSRLSIGELNARVAALAAEIERIRAEVARKQAHSAAANSVFKQG